MPGAAVRTLEDALSTAAAIGYPVLVRPSYVLGGRAMEVVQDANELVRYFGAALAENTGAVLIDKYLVGRSIYTTSPEGTAESSVTYTRIWGKNALMLFTPDQPALMTPDEVSALLRADLARWEKPIKATGVTLE